MAQTPPGRARKKRIAISRSRLQEYLLCPLRSRFRRDAPMCDDDLDRPKLIGREFHKVMERYVSWLLASGRDRDAELLKSIALIGDARYQPDLLHLASLTGPGVSVDGSRYLSHGRLYAHVLPNFGADGQDVALTVRPDLVTRGGAPGEVRVHDWKTGWSKAGFEFQAIFCCLVVGRSLGEATRVIWQPLLCRFGAWGPAFEYSRSGLDDCEKVIRQAAGQYLQETEWLPRPGVRRCRVCPYVERCDAQKRFAEIDQSPSDFVLATLKLKNEVRCREEAQSAHVGAHGPIQTGQGWWGVNPIKQRVTFAFHKAAPGLLGQEMLSETPPGPPCAQEQMGGRR